MTEIPPAPEDFKLLEKEFHRHGFIYKQVKRTPSCAMYAVTTKSGGLLGHEVVTIKIAPAVYMKITKSWVSERETYPGSEEFGERGWYYMHPQQTEKAESKYVKICMDHGEA